MKKFKGKFFIMMGGALLIVVLLATAIPYVISRNQQVHASGPNPIEIENGKPGTPGWNDFSADLAQDTLSGFGSKISVNHGESLDFYVTTTAPSFTIDIFRTGYYGGIGAREITSLGSFPGLHQAIPAPNATTGIISCSGWTKTTSLTIPSDWVTGIYLAKLTSSTGNSSFIFFVVRDDGGSEDLLFQASVTTYQAYNVWGGTSLYNNALTGANHTTFPYPHATKVSFDRPFNPGDSNGAGHYFFFEYKFVYWMEQQGYNVAYTTDIDTDQRPNELLTRKAFLSVGHDEYWTMGMRNAVQNAITHGVNIASFGANTMYWQIRLEPNSAGAAARVEVGYKDFAAFDVAPGPDPLWNVNNSLVTANWRDPVVNMPENGLFGVMYEQQEDADYAYVVQNASNWIYSGTGFTDGTTIPGIVGYEYDRVWDNGFAPAGLTVLSNSPVHGCCGGFSSYSNATLYTASSGARVFSAGTIQWSWGLAAIQSNPYTNAGIQKTTANILNNFIGISTAPTSMVSLSSSSLSFGNQGINATGAAQTVKITNKGTTALTIASILVKGTNSGDFAQTNNCPSSLAANANCTISVTFKPTASGTRMGTITITDNSPEGSQDVILNGTGIGSGAAVNLSATQLNFGNQTVNTTSPSQTVTVTNTGLSTLTFSYIQNQGANPNDFIQSNNCPTSLAVGASCTVTISFKPAATSTRGGSVVFGDNASDSPQMIILSGTGVSANSGVTLSPLNLNFGSVEVGHTGSPQTTTLTNNTTTPLTINSIMITGTAAQDFAFTTTCPASPNTLAAGVGCTITVTFSPQETEIGTRTASVVITHNGPGSPQNVSLNGDGFEDDLSGISLNPVTINFGSQNNGTTSAAQTITVTSNGAIPLGISDISIVGTNPGDFSQTNNCPMTPNTLAVNATCTITVKFTPTVSGVRNATVTLTDNTDGEGEATQTVSLNGTGVNPNTSVYFSDGFESGNFSQWSGGASGTGAATVQTSVVNSGTQAAQLTNTTSSQLSEIITNINGGVAPTLSYTRFAFRFSSLSGTTLIAMAQDSSSHSIWIIYYDSARKGLDVYFWNASGTRYDIYSNTNLINPNTWYTIEVGSNQATSGHGEVWLNGTSIGSFDGNLTETLGYSRLVLVNEVTGTAYFDDVAVANNYAIPSSSAGLTLNPTSINYGNQTQGVASGAQTVTLTNTGSAALTISSIAVTGANAGDFTQANSCSSTLAANTSCTINVTFTPGANGSRSASISVADSAPGAPHTIGLTGTGVAVAPIVSLNPGSLNFGNQNVGVVSSAQTIQVTNSGTAALTINNISVTGTNASDFAQTNTCPGSLGVSASCNITIRFTPSASGARSASISIADNATGTPQTAALSGTGVGSSPSAYFSDGFEGGNFSQWTGGASGTGAATVQTSVANKGTHAAQLTNTTSTQLVEITTNINGGVAPTLSYTRFTFRFSSLSGTTLIAMAQDNNSHSIWIIYYDSARKGLDVYFWNASGTRYDIYSNMNVLSPDTWYTIEVESNQVSSGHGEVWLNGTSIGSFDGNLTETLGYSKLVLVNEAIGTAYFDDVAVSTSYNGLVALTPVNGTNIPLSVKVSGFNAIKQTVFVQRRQTTLEL